MYLPTYLIVLFNDKYLQSILKLNIQVCTVLSIVIHFLLPGTSVLSGSSSSSKSLPESGFFSTFTVVVVVAVSFDAQKMYNNNILVSSVIEYWKYKHHYVAVNRRIYNGLSCIIHVYLFIVNVVLTIMSDGSAYRGTASNTTEGGQNTRFGIRVGVGID